MNTHSKILIDKWAGSITIWLIGTLSFLFRINSRAKIVAHGNYRSIAIAKYLGMGSIIQATPLIETIRTSNPSCRIIFVTSKTNQGTLDLVDNIDNVILIEDKNILRIVFSTFSLFQKIWRLQPDVFIDLEHYSNYGKIVASMSGASIKMGFHKENAKHGYGAYSKTVPFMKNTSFSETYLQFAKELKLSSITSELKLKSPNFLVSLPSSINDHLNGNSFIIINPNASDLRIERRWPIENFTNTIEFLFNNFPDLKIVLIGNSKETTYVEHLKKKVGEHANLINTAGQLNQNQLAFLIQNAKLLLTNDTGPMHMALALGTRTISLYGPSAPEQFVKYKTNTVLYENVSCSPCVHLHLRPPCNGDNICMKKISTESVNQALLRSLT